MNVTSRRENMAAIAANCTRFLGARPRPVRERLLEAAESELSLMRNDVYGVGGYLAEFEKEIAELLGKEACVFMPSGTMAQQIALRIWSDQAGCKRVAFHPTCHLHIHEKMGYSELHHLEGVLLGDAERLFTLADVQAIEGMVSTLLIELPQREIGGQLPSWQELTAICDAARARNMKLHLDGARVWECAPFYENSYAEICAPFDSVYVSFYKLIGGFPGAALAGPRSFIEEAKVWQRRHGGNLQQQSPAVISAKLGMERQLPRVAEYVRKAGELAAVFKGFEQIMVVPENPPTNMMHLYLKGDPEKLVDAALQIAEEDKVVLFFGLGQGGKFELSVGSGTMELTHEEIRELFEKLFRLAGT